MAAQGMQQNDTDPIIKKSPSDQKAYKALKLQNGMRVILIHDPDMGTGEDPNPLGHHNHPGEDEVLTDEEAASLMSDESGSEGSGSESDDEGSEDGSMSTDANEGHVRAHHPRTPHHAGPVKKAAAAVSVTIGHFSDPTHLPGLSHYLEHMLFMGSDKFPDENDYDAYLSANSGSSNAYTEEEATTFYFDCKPGALRGGLERFSRFFVAPLVKADAMEREVQAVDNEFSGVLQSDSCRLMQLRATTSHPTHPYSKFGWGNRKSLEIDPKAAGIDVRSELLEYYTNNYAAERMGLVVLGGEPLETLETWVNELFDAVPGGKGPRPRFESAGFPYKGGRFHIVPGVTEGHKLSATFQLPCLEDQYHKKADEYLSHLIGHEGSGSLLSALKSRGLATEVCAGVSDQTSAAWLFEVTITLTQAGLRAGSGCGLEAARLLFEYLAMLKQAGPQQWAFEEMAAIADLKFRFQEEEDPSDYVAQLASAVHTYPIEDAIVGPYLHKEFDSELISSLLKLMSPDNARLDLQTSAFEECRAALVTLGATSVTDGKEPWFDFPYVQADLPSSVLDTWNKLTPCSDIKLPPRNNYLPTDFALCCDTSSSKNGLAETSSKKENGSSTETTTAADKSAFPEPPSKIVDTSGLRVWHKMDSSFKLPRTNAYFRLITPKIYTTPAAAAATHLTVKLLEDALCETTYLADVAGLQYTLWFAGVEGVDIKFDGFSHKLPLLVDHVFNSLVQLQFDEDTFKRVKEALLRQYKNVNMKPIKHSTYLRLRTLREAVFEVEDIRKEIEGLTVEGVREFVTGLLDEVHVEAYIHGNITADDAQKVALNASQKLTKTKEVATNGNNKASPFPIQRGNHDRCLDIPNNTTLLYRSPVKNHEEENTVIEIYFQASTDNPQERALIDMIDQLTHEPCYDTLRTKEQLGYTVHSGPRMTLGVAGFCVVVQSGVHGPIFLEERVDAFLASFAEKLREMPSEEFEKQRTALLASKLTKDRNMLEESDRNWDAITLRGCDFWQKMEEVAALKEITQQEVLQRYKEVLLPGLKSRKKLSVYVVGKGHLEDLEKAIKKPIVVVESVEEVKKNYGFFPAVVERR